MADITTKQKKPKKKSDSFRDEKNVVQKTESTDKVTEIDNDYITLVNKKIRSLNKKIRTIEEIEKKVEAGAKINYDQQQIIANRAATVGALKELETLRSKFMKIHIEVIEIFHRKVALLLIY